MLVEDGRAGPVDETSCKNECQLAPLTKTARRRSGSKIDNKIVFRRLKRVKGEEIKGLSFVYSNYIR